MRPKIYYGGESDLTQEDRELFSRGDYECKALMRTENGKPVIISQHRDDPRKCRVDYDWSTLAFGSIDDAISYCVRHFKSLSKGGK